MSTITLGPPMVLDGPVPVAPPRSLLNTAQFVETTDTHYLAGGQVYSYPTDLPTVHDPCADGTFRLKPDGSAWDNPTFGPYTVVMPITCSAYEGKNPGFADRARIALQARESFAVARELSQGATAPLNPYFCDANVTLLAAGAAVAPDVGLSYLEEAIGATGQMGMIHATPAVGNSWNTTGGDGLTVASGRLVTAANGTPVALDGGYVGARPTGGSAAAAGQSWVFATGPVQYRRGDIQIIAPDLAGTMDREINLVTYRAERDYVVVWDIALQAAVLVDWTP
jgi:hypothetical protein